MSKKTDPDPRDKPLVDAIRRSRLPVVTEYQVARLMLDINRSQFTEGGGEGSIKLIRSEIRSLCAGKRPVLVKQTDFNSGVWYVVGASRAASAEEAICIADPFAWVSHLSAMYRYGLTNRSPVSLHMTTPEDGHWNQLRADALRKIGLDPETITGRFLTRPGWRGQVRGRTIVMHRQRKQVETIKVDGEETRIASIGSVFASMLTEPNLCGGMSHVIDCYINHAKPWLEQIIEAVERVDSNIAKLRAGHILQERLKISNLKILEWKRLKREGGSNLLDPGAPRGSHVSNEWGLYINA